MTSPHRTLPRDAWRASVAAVAPTGQPTTVVLTLTADESAAVLLAAGTVGLVAPHAARQFSTALLHRRNLAIPLHVGSSVLRLAMTSLAVPGAGTGGARLALAGNGWGWPLLLGPRPVRQLARVLDEAAGRCRRGW
ncbi:hypothetical protein [Actinoalloteichus caeruleus]|uniref:hypothetical protein n=1 Tax=Actinoalloteichus cyanogriseus TaxID=2893586 RepID=UPI003AAA5E7F